MEPSEVFERELPLIERVIASVCRRNCCFGDEAEDFDATVKLKLIENDYAVLRKFAGRSSLSTFLTTVIMNLFRDYRIAKWGKWRPSAAAKRMGAVAVQLETLVSRDGLVTAEAIEILKTNFGLEEDRDELYRIAEQLPHRTKRRFEGSDVLETLGASDGVERRVVDGEMGEAARQAEAALDRALADLEAEDRLLLKLRFGEGFTVAQIAARLNLPQRPLYTRYEKSLRSLRARMEKEGVSTGDVRRILDWDRLDLNVEYDVPDGPDGNPPEASV